MGVGVEGARGLRGAEAVRVLQELGGGGGKAVGGASTRGGGG